MPRPVAVLVFVGFVGFAAPPVAAQQSPNLNVLVIHPFEGRVQPTRITRDDYRFTGSPGTRPTAKPW